MIDSEDNLLDGANRPITRERVRNELFRLAERLDGEPGLAGEILWTVFGPLLIMLDIGREYFITTDSFRLVDLGAKQRYRVALDNLGDDKQKASVEDKELCKEAWNLMLVASAAVDSSTVGVK
jgi:hypothetical protein